MLPASARLRRREDFDVVVRRGRRSGRGGLVVHLLAAELAAEQSAEPNADRATVAPARIGVIVGKQVGNAVRRNEVSRRLRHVMRDRLDRLDAADRLVLRALPAAAGRTSAQLGADLDGALQRLAPVRR